MSQGALQNTPGDPSGIVVEPQSQTTQITSPTEGQVCPAHTAINSSVIGMVTGNQYVLDLYLCDSSWAPQPPPVWTSGTLPASRTGSWSGQIPGQAAGNYELQLIINGTSPPLQVVDFTVS